MKRLLFPHAGKATQFVLAAAIGCLALCPVQTHAQKALRVLFVGNSYTGANNLPGMVRSLALSAGDTLMVDAWNPGGTTLADHAADTTVWGKLGSQPWDAVVMQEQSQVPVIPHFRHALMYPGGAELDSLIEARAPGCARRVLFLTWGRKNGGQQCNNGFCSYPFSDFFGFQDTLTWAYQQLADQVGAAIAPVGEAWRRALQFSPAVPLHQADESHPTPEGSYLAACVLYATLFQKPADGIMSDYGLDPAFTALARAWADSTLWSRLPDWRIDTTALFASLVPASNGFLVEMNLLTNATTLLWDLGDGSTHTGPLASHDYPPTPAIYTINLTAIRECDTLQTSAQVSLPATAQPEALQNPMFRPTPNPATTGIWLQNPSQSDARVRILNLHGQQTCPEIKLHPGRQFVSTDGWAAGLHFVAVWNDSQLLGVYKIVISR